MDLLVDHLPPIISIIAVFACGIYVAGIFWFASGIGRATPRTDDQPFVSVVITARDEADHLEACIAHLLDQTYPAAMFEILLVDDGSSDGSEAIGQQLAASCDRVRFLRRDQGGSKKEALEWGIATCTGEIVLTTDAHCLVPRSWIDDLVSCFAPEVGMVVGYSESVGGGGICGLLQAWEAVDFLCLMGSAAGSAGHGRALGASGQSLAFRKIVFQEVGGYERVRQRVSGDDVLLLHLIRRHTAWRTVFNVSAAAVSHPTASSWHCLLSQRARWASNAPFQLLLNPLFFLFLVNSFSLSVAVVASPALVVLGLVNWSLVVAIFLLKIFAETVLFTRAAAQFGRQDLQRYFPWWALTLPVYTVCVGLLGLLGRFSWKDIGYAWGRTGHTARRDSFRDLS